MKVCVITDNLYIYEHFVDLLRRKPQDAEFDFYYATWNHAFREKFGENGGMRPIKLREQGDEFFNAYDLFISLHHNATGCGGNPREARHTVTYASNDKGLALARAVQKHVAQVMVPVRDNGAQIKSLAVCRNPAIPSCLVEVDFINLPEGEEESGDPVRREKVSKAILMGILDWIAE